MTTIEIPRKPSTGGKPAYALNPEISDIIDKLAKHGCSARLIADYLEIDPSVFTDNIDYSNAYKKSYCQAGIRVAHRQYELLESDKEQTAALMAIWLGKQHLGQSDKAQPLETQPIINVTLHVVDTRKPKVIDVTPEPEPEELPLIEDKGT